GTSRPTLPTVRVPSNSSRDSSLDSTSNSLGSRAEIYAGRNTWVSVLVEARQHADDPAIHDVEQRVGEAAQIGPVDRRINFRVEQRVQPNEPLDALQLSEEGFALANARLVVPSKRVGDLRRLRRGA
ncbi:hypothetical protein, partial [Roseateles saccharophilus]